MDYDLNGIKYIKLLPYVKWDIHNESIPEGMDNIIPDWDNGNGVKDDGTIILCYKVGNTSPGNSWTGYKFMDRTYNINELPTMTHVLKAIYNFYHKETRCIDQINNFIFTGYFRCIKEFKYEYSVVLV